MKARIAILFLLVLSLLTGCGSGGVYVPTGDGLDHQQATRPQPVPEDRVQELSLVYVPGKSFNPYTCADFTNRALFSLLYQSLFVVNGDYVAEPQLCRGYSVSDDHMTYVFYPEKAKFSDGTLLTAGDVLASLEAARTSPVYKGRFTRVASLALTLDGGVEVQLTTPYEDFLILLDVPIVRAAQVEADFPAGTGPYALENGVSGPWLRLRQDWWCEAALPVYAPEIPLRAAASATGIRDLFERQDVGVVCANPASDSYVDFRCDYELWDCENGGFLYLGCRAKSTVFSNQTVRRALTHAIDRRSLVMDYYRTFGLPATLPASPDSPYYNRTLAKQFDYAPGVLRQVLEEEDLLDSAVVLLVNKADGRRLRVAEAVQKMLEAEGLQVTLRMLQGQDYVSALNNGRYDLHLGQTVLSPNMDLSVFFDPDGALDFCGMEDAGIYSLCQDALANRGNYTGLHRAVMEDGMLCPVAFLSYAVFAHRGLLEDFSPARDCIFYYSLGKSQEDVRIFE